MMDGGMKCGAYAEEMNADNPNSAATFSGHKPRRRAKMMAGVKR